MRHWLLESSTQGAGGCAIAPGIGAPRRWISCSGPYADAYASALDDAALTRLEALMEEADTDLLKWVMGQEPPPADADRELLDRLIAFRQTTVRMK